MTETTAAVEPSTQTCKNCGQSFTGNFCNRCGEKVYHEHDRSVFHFLEDGVHFITHLDGTLINSVRTIFAQPGQLSLDYTNGIRKKYFRPLSLFLLLVVLYLVFPLFTGLNMPLKFHFTQSAYGEYALKKVAAYLEHHAITKEELSQKFAAKSEKTSKFMLFIIIPLSAIPLWLFGWKKRPYLFDHLLLSTEINSFYLIYTFFLLPLLLTLISLVQKLIHQNFMGWFTERMLSVVVYIGTAIFVSVAFRRFYGFKPWVRFAAIAVFLIAHYFIVYTIYKFLLFITVMALI